MHIEDAEIFAAAINALIKSSHWDVLYDKISKRLGARAFMLQEYNLKSHETPIFHASHSMRIGDGAEVLKEVIAGKETAQADRVISRLTDGYQTLVTLFDKLKFGVAFCDPQGGILLMNDKMSTWAQDSDGISNNQNRLEAVVGVDKTLLASAMEKCVVIGSDTEGTTLSIERRSGRAPFVVYLTPINEPSLHLDTVLLMIALDPEETVQITADGLALVGHLTTAERRVYDLLISGLDTEAVSEQHGTSIETVRGQIKSIMHKLECKRRIDLIRLAMVTSPALHFDGPNRSQ